MFTDLLEIIMSYLQFLVLVINTDPALWPSSWQSASVVASVVNLDSAFFKTYASFVPQDFRVYFVFVAVLIPLGLILFGLLALNSKKVVLWYGVLLAGLTALVVGTLAIILESAGGFSIAQEVAFTLVITGGVGVFCCIVAVVIAKLCGVDKEDIASVKELKVEQTAKMQPLILLQQVLLFAVLVTFGILLVAFNVSGLNDVFGSLGVALAIVCFVFAGFTVLFFLLGLCISGRRALWALEQFASQNFMRLLLITLSILYIPIGASTMSIFNCNPFECAVGERLADQDSFVPLGLNITSHSYCNLCTVPAMGQQCPVDFMNSLCLPLEENRLESDKTLQCTRMRAFFWPSAAIVAVVFVFGTPLMFFALVRRSTSILRDEFPIKNPSSNEQKNWEMKVENTDNVAKFLYQSYKFTFRYGRIFQLIHKLLIVGSTAYVVRVGDTSPVIVALVAATVVHSLAMLLLVIARPFLRSIEGVTASALTVLVVLLVILGMVLFAEADVPVSFLTAVLVFCCVAPILFLVVGLVIEYVSARNAAGAKAAVKKSKMDVQVELIATIREHDRVILKISETRENLAGELLTQRKLEKNPTAAAKDTIRRSLERTVQLRDELRQYEGFLDELKDYRRDLENGDIDMEASMIPEPVEATASSPALPAMEASIVVLGEGGRAGSPRASPALSRSMMTTSQQVNRPGAGGGGQQRMGQSQRAGKPSGQNSSSASPSMSPRMGGHNSMSTRPNTNQGGRGRGGASSGASNGRLGVNPNVIGRPPVSPNTLGRPSSMMGSSQSNFDQANRRDSLSSSGRGAMSPAGPTNRGGAPVRRSSLDTSGSTRGSFEGTTRSGSMTRPTTKEAGRPTPLAIFSEGGGGGGGITPTPTTPGAGGIVNGRRPSMGSALIIATLGEGSPRFLPRKNSDSGSDSVSTPVKTFGASASNLVSPISQRGNVSQPDRSPVSQSSSTKKKGNPDQSPASFAVPMPPAMESPSAPGMDSPNERSVGGPKEQVAAGNPMLSLGGLGVDEWADSSSGDEKSSSEEEDFDVSDSDDDEDFKNKKKSTDQKKAEAMSSKRTDSPTGGLRKTKSVFSEAANAVAALLAAEEEDEEDRQETVDHNINTAMQNTLNRFLMVGGIAGFVALGFALLGLLTATDEGVVHSDYSSTAVANQFSGYSNWSVMVTECCCLPYQPDLPNTIAGLEKWVCTSGDIMERVRATRTVDDEGRVVSELDGYAIRSLCATNFTSTNCEAYSDAAGVVQLVCNEPSITNVQRQLW